MTVQELLERIADEVDGQPLSNCINPILVVDENQHLHNLDSVRFIRELGALVINTSERP